MLNFAVLKNNRSIQENHVLSYAIDEYSFDVEPYPNISRMFYIGVNDLMIAVGMERELLFVDGFHPYSSWIQASLLPPKCEKHVVKVVMDDARAEDLAGITNNCSAPVVEPIAEINRKTHYPSYFDKQNGWLCVGDIEIEEKDTPVCFSKNSIMVLRDNRFHALWIQPENHQDLKKLKMKKQKAGR